MGVIRDRAATRGHSGDQHTPWTLHRHPPLVGTPRSPCPSEDHQLAVSPGRRHAVPEGQWGHPDLGHPMAAPYRAETQQEGGGHERDKVAGVACLSCHAMEHLGTAGLVWQILSGDPGEFGCTEARQQPPVPAVPSRAHPSPSHVSEGPSASRRARCPAAPLRPVPAVFAFVPGK